MIIFKAASEERLFSRSKLARAAKEWLKVQGQVEHQQIIAADHKEHSQVMLRATAYKTPEHVYVLLASYTIEAK